MNIEVYTDGSANTANKPGGWAYVLIVDGKKYSECAGHMSGATNNDAEMEAAIQGLGAALKYVIDKTPQYSSVTTIPDVTLVADSQLVLGWASGTYRFKQIEKINKYYTLQSLAKRLSLKTRWTKGHNGDEHNERCDKLANEARLSINRKSDKEIAKLSGETCIGTKKSGTICIWYRGTLKVIDLESNIVENYERSKHGPRGGVLEIREDKSR